MAEGFVRLGFRGQEIIDKVTDVCQTFPSEFRSNYIEFSYRRLPKLIDDVELLRPVSDICEIGKICTNSNLKTKVPIPKNGVFCDLCTDLVNAAAQALIDQKVEEEIEDMLERLCDELPSVVGILCRSIVAQYTPVILAWLEEGIESLEICVRLGLCDA
jgi:hypothetical protein